MKLKSSVITDDGENHILQREIYEHESYETSVSLMTKFIDMPDLKLAEIDFKDLPSFFVGTIDYNGRRKRLDYPEHLIIKAATSRNIKVIADVFETVAKLLRRLD